MLYNLGVVYEYNLIKLVKFRFEGRQYLNPEVKNYMDFILLNNAYFYWKYSAQHTVV